MKALDRDERALFARGSLRLSSNIEAALSARARPTPARASFIGGRRGSQKKTHPSNRSPDRLASPLVAVAGGLSRALSQSQEERTASARAAAQARWSRTPKQDRVAFMRYVRSRRGAKVAGVPADPEAGGARLLELMSRNH